MLGWSMVVNTKYLANPGGQRPLVEIAQVSIFAVDSTVVVDGLGVRRVLLGRRLGVDASPQHHFAEGTEKHEQFKLVFKNQFKNVALVQNQAISRMILLGDMNILARE